MTSRFAPSTFAIAFCCTYAAAFFFNLPMFLYYPLHGDFSWGTMVLTDVGPGMAWYGFVADSLVVASILAVVIPERVIGKVFRNFVWVFPCAAMALCVYLLWDFFWVG